MSLGSLGQSCCKFAGRGITLACAETRLPDNASPTTVAIANAEWLGCWTHIVEHGGSIQFPRQTGGFPLTRSVFFSSRLFDRRMVSSKFAFPSLSTPNIFFMWCFAALPQEHWVRRILRWCPPGTYRIGRPHFHWGSKLRLGRWTVVAMNGNLWDQQCESFTELRCIHSDLVHPSCSMQSLSLSLRFACRKGSPLQGANQDKKYEDINNL